MNRNEYGQFVKEKKSKSGVSETLAAVGLGGAGGAAAGYGVGKGIQKASEHYLGKASLANELKNKVKPEGAKAILQGMIEKSSSKVGKLETLLKRAGGAKGFAIKSGIAGLGATALASLMKSDDDDEDEA